MFRTYKAMVVAITADIRASGTPAGGSQDGVTYFTKVIVGAGLRVRPALPTAGADLQAHPSTSGDQVVLDSRSTAVRAVPVDVSMEARGISSPRPLRVGGVHSKADVLTECGGFKASLLMANNGTLTLSRVPGVESALAVVTLSYQ